jgi:seryl-tRNA synthetase
MNHSAFSVPAPDDSAELAAIRERNVTRVDGEESAYRDRDTLLRMVDELTEQRDRAQRVMTDAMRSSGTAQIQLSERTKERDELRAKLAELYAFTRQRVSLCGDIFSPSNKPGRVMLTCRLWLGHDGAHSYRPPPRDTDEEYEKDIAFMADNEATVQRERDELQKENAELMKDVAYMSANEASYQKEIEELRAKLRDAMNSLDKAATSAGQMFLESDQYRKRAEAAEAKLAAMTSGRAE